VRLMKHHLHDYDVALVGPELEVERYRRDVGQEVLKLRGEVAMLRDLFAREQKHAREGWDEVDRLRTALEEREADMHMRIRQGYDKTVADCWRAKVALLEKALEDAPCAWLPELRHEPLECTEGTPCLTHKHLGWPSPSESVAHDEKAKT